MDIYRYIDIADVPYDLILEFQKTLPVCAKILFCFLYIQTDKNPLNIDININSRKIIKMREIKSRSLRDIGNSFTKLSIHIFFDNIF